MYRRVRVVDDETGEVTVGIYEVYPVWDKEFDLNFLFSSRSSFPVRICWYDNEESEKEELDMITDAMLLPILTDDNFEYSSVF